MAFFKNYMRGGERIFLKPGVSYAGPHRKSKTEKAAFFCRLSKDASAKSFGIRKKESHQTTSMFFKLSNGDNPFEKRRRQSKDEGKEKANCVCFFPAPSFHWQHSLNQSQYGKTNHTKL